MAAVQVRYRAARAPETGFVREPGRRAPAAGRSGRWTAAIPAPQPQGEAARVPGRRAVAACVLRRGPVWLRYAAALPRSRRTEGGEAAVAWLRFPAPRSAPG